MFIINSQSSISLANVINNWLDYIKLVTFNFSDKFFLSEHPTKESFYNLMLTVLKNILP